MHSFFEFMTEQLSQEDGSIALIEINYPRQKQSVTLSLEGNLYKDRAGIILERMTKSHLGYFEHFLVRLAQYANIDVNHVLNAYHHDSVYQFKFQEDIKQIHYEINLVCQSLIHRDRITCYIRQISTDELPVIDFDHSFMQIKCTNGLETQITLTDFLKTFFEDDYEEIMSNALTQYAHTIANKKDS